MIKAIYAGSFDPITLGHLDIISRAAKCFELSIGIANNPKKKHWLSIENRQDLVAQSIVSVSPYLIDVHIIDGLLANFCKTNGIQVLIRGLRNTIDFEYETSMYAVNSRLAHLETVFFPAQSSNSHISSSVVRELVSLGVDVSPYVPEAVLRFLQKSA